MIVRQACIAVLGSVVGALLTFSTAEAQNCRCCDENNECQLAEEGSHFCDDELPGVCSLIIPQCGDGGSFASLSGEPEECGEVNFLESTGMTLDGSYKIALLDRTPEEALEALKFQPVADGLLVQRRECDGAILARTYTLRAEAELRRRVAELRLVQQQ